LSALEHLFLVDVKRRLINNTPWDVFKLASQLERGTADCIDLRFRDEDSLPDATHAYLFLETAGTWMCFDWNEPRMAARVARLRARYPRLTLVGPQAAALREALNAEEVEAIGELEFERAIAAAYDPEAPIDSIWVASTQRDRYNGEWYRDRQFQLAPTVSIYHSMNCPMSCEFCFYRASRHHKRSSLASLTRDLARLCESGIDHFFFMDPNFILNRADWDRLRQLKSRYPDYSYYCQMSPNLLTADTIEALRDTGCAGMVVGIENAELIRYKGELGTARRALESVREAGMMPMLYFLIDGESDVLAARDGLRGFPFRHGIINHAFAGDRSLASIRDGFTRRDALRERSRDVIAALRADPDHLENAPRASEVAHA
jgi:hypothetical protein